MKTFVSHVYVYKEIVLYHLWSVSEEKNNKNMNFRDYHKFTFATYMDKVHLNLYTR